MTDQIYYEIAERLFKQSDFGRSKKYFEKARDKGHDRAGKRLKLFEGRDCKETPVDDSSFLLGEQDFEDGNFEEALGHFRSAQAKLATHFIEVLQPQKKPPVSTQNIKVETGIGMNTGNATVTTNNYYGPQPTPNTKQPEDSTKKNTTQSSQPGPTFGKGWEKYKYNLAEMLSGNKWDRVGSQLGIDSETVKSLLTNIQPHHHVAFVELLFERQIPIAEFKIALVNCKLNDILSFIKEHENKV